MYYIVGASLRKWDLIYLSIKNMLRIEVLFFSFLTKNKIIFNPRAMHAHAQINLCQFIYLFIYFWIQVYFSDGMNFVFSTDSLTANAGLDPAGLVAIAIAHAFALFVAVSIAANISGGHVNPAVTFGLVAGGQMTVITGLFYWIAQLLGAVVGSFLLSFVTGGLVSQRLYISISINKMIN